MNSPRESIFLMHEWKVLEHSELDKTESIFRKFAFWTFIVSQRQMERAVWADYFSSYLNKNRGQSTLATYIRMKAMMGGSGGRGGCGERREVGTFPYCDICCMIAQTLLP